MGNKAGFTLVELAVVLVVIGLILGMAIKGKTLIDLAIARAEVAKIYKIQTAYNIAISEGINAPTMADIVNLNLITSGDLTTRYAANRNGRKYDTFEISEAHKYTNPSITWYCSAADPTCVESFPVIRFFMGGTAPIISEKYACYIELFLDDLSAQGGQGRGYNLYNLYSPAYPAGRQTEKDYFDNCSSYPQNKTHPYAGFYSFAL